jgi:chromosome segregation ATPase
VQLNTYNLIHISLQLIIIWLKYQGKYQQKITDIVGKITDLKTRINTLKSKITNNEDVIDSYFEKVLTQLESSYQFIMTNVIEVHSGSCGSGESVC